MGGGRDAGVEAPVTLDRTIAALAMLGGLAGLGSAALGVHVKATLADTNEAISLLKKEDVSLKERLEIEKGYRRAVLARLDALCRATPQANCPLGENER
jgi:hypothetical protein